jgi:dTDP-glucose 4,6-dehydratase
MPAAVDATPHPREPRRILVTGGLGFIGAEVVRALLRGLPEARVVNLDLETYAADPTRLGDARTHPGYLHVRGDVADPDLVASLFREHAFDTVLHLAAESHVDRSIADAAPFLRTNVTGTWTLLEAAREAWREGSAASGEGPAPLFVHVSTDEVFGDLAPDEAPFTPDSPYRPSSPYSASKAAADHFVSAARRTWGIPSVIVHPSNTYGPGQHAEKFIPTVLRTAHAGMPVPLYGDGSNIRDWLHVEDLAHALLLVATCATAGRRYLVGAGNERTNLLMAESLCQLLDVRYPQGAPHRRHLSFVQDRPGHDRRYAVDATRIARELGWTPARSLAEGLADTVRGWGERHDGPGPRAGGAGG